MSNKPVYVPSHKRKRFHGAFTGGFSAGYFNTVGTKDGWKPRENAVVQQNAEDYMDDQDFDEWGGPKSVKRDYTATEDQTKPSASVLDWSIIQPPTNVGTRLLRCLGWREGSAAYIPDTDRGTKSTGNQDEETHTLSQKRLRKIQLQQKMVRIPVPKLDRGGLGYDIYGNAPEFQADRDKRRREARHRAQAATTSGGTNAYRLSDLQNKDGHGPTAGKVGNRPNPDQLDEHYLSFETVQEFVGNKTAGGFAIREDDDDVYDENPLQRSALQINKDEYDTEIFEHESDAEDADATNKPSLGGILSSWATGDAKTSNRGVTSDGRPPLSGFCLGGATTQGDNTRFPGPEIPANYVLQRHQFREDEHPAQLQQIARQEKVQERRQQALKRLADPMAGGTFSGLAAAMKNRFTSAVTPVTTQVVPTPIGLHRPTPSVKPVEHNENAIVQKEVKNEIAIKTTYMTFYPDVLVCKRFGVNPPVHAKNRAPEQKQSAESVFFKEEVMKRAAEARPKLATRTEGNGAILDEDQEMDQSSTCQRPSMDVLQAIYEPNSGSEADDDDVGNLESASRDFERSNDELVIRSATTANVPVESAMISATTTTAIVPAVQSVVAEKQDDETDERRHRKKRKRRKREERRRHRDRSPSVSSSETDLDALSSSEGGERRTNRIKRRRNRDEKKKSKDEKKRRKKHKSSRRYED